MKHKRLNLVLVIIIVFSAAIIGRLIYIQVLNHNYWEAMAQGQQKFSVEEQGDRGEVFFQDMTGLAINQNFPLVYAAPNEIKNKQEASEMLSLVLGLDKDSILEKFKKDSFYAVLKKKLTDEEVSAIKSLNLAGIYLDNEKGRYYPFGNLASQVIGFLGGDGKGQYGIEGYYDNVLQGKKEQKELEKWLGGLFNWGGQETDNSKGADLVLTIDYNIQFMAEQLLQKARESLEFQDGEILVMDPNSGKILALANLPDFNPNDYSLVKDLEVFQDSSVQKIFEPGSVFKPITMAAALDQGKITPDTKFTDEGSVKIGGHTIVNFNYKTWGERTMTEVLEWSINTGAVFAEQQLPHDVFLDYIDRFGFFDKTGIDLQSEIASQNQEMKKGYEINFATASFGQGIEMTSIQLARAFCAIANGGKLLRPYVVDKIIENGKATQTKPQVQDPSVISQKTASQLTLMLVNVVDNGYGKLAGVPGYYIAGKTGTAQVSWSALGANKNGYSDETVQSFIGFGPALDPRFLILVKLNNPKALTSEYSAAPIFGEMAKYIIDYWKIAPDHGE
jgi:stage V sporulation protein D (sporulation-specific penicillin-binding protein)